MPVDALAAVLVLLVVLLHVRPLLPDQVNVQRRLLFSVTPQNVAAHEPRQVLGHLVAYEVALAHREDQVQVFEGPPLGLFDEEEHEDEGEKVQAREEAKGPAVVEAGVDAAGGCEQVEISFL